MNRPLTVAHINTTDLGGGAESVARSLHRALHAGGHRSLLVVGYRRSDDPQVRLIPPDGRLRRVRDLQRLLATAMGWQGLGHPGSFRIPDLVGEPVDLFHAHNLHGDYFNLAAVRRLARQAPVVMTLHDPWLLTGHCAHPFDCGRWRTGCGSCPDLTIYPAVLRDGTRFNWKRKRRLLARTRLWLSAPSRWLLDMLADSFLAHAPRKLIYNGVDRRVFRPGDRAAARADLGLPPDRPILLYSANSGIKHPWKDTPTLLAALGRFAAWPVDQRPMLLALGGASDEAAIDEAPLPIVTMPWFDDRERMARYLQAADLLVYPTLADNCPLTVLEALSCGQTVVANSVGGIPELIEDGRTGVLVRSGDAEQLSAALVRLLADPEERRRLGGAAAEEAARRFDERIQVKAYLDWYHEVLATEREPASVPEPIMEPVLEGGRRPRTPNG